MVQTGEKVGNILDVHNKERDDSESVAQGNNNTGYLHPHELHNKL